MLVVDPEKRYSIQQIKQHRWTRDNATHSLSPSTSCPSLLENMSSLSVRSEDGPVLNKYGPARMSSLGARDNSDGCDEEGTAQQHH